MAYTINKTDGSILTTVPDGQVDNLSTDITLIGKNYSGFGEILNENLVKMLENFASVSRPVNPLRGELWFDSSESRLKVYNGVDFATVGSATISPQQPTTLNPGDFWYNDTDRQLYFYDGSNTILIGPLYSTIQGLSGFRVENIIDTLNQNRVVVALYVGGTILGIFSKDTFTPKNDIVGFSGQILPGFNAGTLAGIKINAVAADSEKLAGRSSDLYMTRDTDNTMAGALALTTDDGITIGSTPGNAEIGIDSKDLYIANTVQDKNFRLVVKKGINPEVALSVTAATQTLSLYGSSPTSTVIAGGNMVVQGDLTVNGTTTTVNSTVLQVEDKNIELAKNPTPTDVEADGGGVILKGDTDHTILWSKDGKAWDSSEHINLVSSVSVPDPAFKINGVTVLDGNSLGTGITSAPGLTSFGQQSDITVDQLYLNDNYIEVTTVDGDLILRPNGTGTLNLSNKRITNVAEPSGSKDAVTKNYADFTRKGMPLIFSLDVSGLTLAAISNYLTLLAPPAEYRDGTEARLLCTSYSNDDVTINLASQFIKNSVTAFTSPSGTANVVQDFTIPPVTIPGPSITITREIKVFRIQAGAWVNIS